MPAKLHHAAVNAVNFEQTVRFFQEVFQMDIDRTAGISPQRKLWFQQGIQVNEVSSINSSAGLWDHIGIQVPDKTEVLTKAFAFGCTPFPGKTDWFFTPDGLLIELME